jgi:hypothetical protein
MLHVVSDPSSLSVVVAAALQRQQAQRAVLGLNGASTAASGQRERHARSGSNDSASVDQQQLPWSVTNNGTNSVSNTGSNGGNSSPRYATFKQLKAAAGNTFSPRPSASGQVSQQT